MEVTQFEDKYLSFLAKREFGSVSARAVMYVLSEFIFISNEPLVSTTGIVKRKDGTICCTFIINDSIQKMLDKIHCKALEVEPNCKIPYFNISDDVIIITTISGMATIADELRDNSFTARPIIKIRDILTGEGLCYLRMELQGLAK